MKTKKSTVHVSKEIADAFGMQGIPNTVIHEPTHTPTPWKLEQQLPGCVHIKGGAYTVTIIETYSPDQEHKEDSANAAFIVKAVNCHEELIEALRKIKENAKWLGEKYEIGEREIGIIERAIAKAEGK